MRLLVVIMFMMLTTNTFGQSAGSGLQGQPLLAIYLLHVGESDKPLPTFVLCLKKPESTEVAGILKEPFWRDADIFVVQKKDFEKVERIVQDRLTASKKTKECAGHSYGSFQVTVVRPKAKDSVILNPDQSIQTFRAIFEQISPSQQKLRFYLKNLLHRLGVDLPVDNNRAG